MCVYESYSLPKVSLFRNVAKVNFFPKRFQLTEERNRERERGMGGDKIEMKYMKCLNLETFSPFCYYDVVVDVCVFYCVVDMRMDVFVFQLCFPSAC